MIGCRSAALHDPDVDLRAAKLLQSNGKLDEALQAATDGSRRYDSNPYWRWQFRLFQVDVHLRQGHLTVADGLLGAQSSALPDNAELQVVWRAYRGRIESSSSRKRRAIELWDEAEGLAVASGQHRLAGEVRILRGGARVALEELTQAEADDSI